MAGEATRPAMSLDEMAAFCRLHDAKVAACAHEFTKDPDIGCTDLGKRCTRCDVHELPWRRREVAYLRARLAASRDEALGDAAAAIDEVLVPYREALSKARYKVADWLSLRGQIAVGEECMAAVRALRDASASSSPQAGNETAPGGGDRD